jgi:hypothetical protein
MPQTIEHNATELPGWVNAILPCKHGVEHAGGSKRQRLQQSSISHYQPKTRHSGFCPYNCWEAVLPMSVSSTAWLCCPAAFRLMVPSFPSAR